MSNKIEITIDDKTKAGADSVVANHEAMVAKIAAKPVEVSIGLDVDGKTGAAESFVNDKAIAANAKLAEQAMEQLRARSEMLLAAFRELRENGLENIGEGGVKKIRAVASELEQARDASLNLAYSFREMAEKSASAAPLEGLADKITRETNSATIAIELLEKKLAEVRQQETTTKIVVDGQAQAASAIDALDGKAKQLAATFAELNAKGFDGITDVDATRYQAVIDRLNQSRDAAELFANELRKVAASDPALANLANTANQIEAAISQATGVADQFSQKLKEVADKKVTAQIDLEGAEKSLAEMRRLGEEAEKSAEKAHSLWLQAAEADRFANEVAEAARDLKLSGDNSAYAASQLSQLENQYRSAVMAANEFRQQARSQDEVARSTIQQSNAAGVLGSTNAKTAAEVDKLTVANRRLDESLQSSAIANQAARLREMGQAAGAAGQQFGSFGSTAGQGILQLAYAVDDLQYGLRGIVNNIPGLLSNLGFGAGLAGVAAIAAVAVSQIESKTQLFSKTYEDLKATLVENPWTSFTQGAEAAKKEVEQAAQKAKLFKDIADAPKAGKKLLEENDAKRAMQWALEQARGAESLKEVEEKIKRIAEDIENGGKQIGAFLPEEVIADQTDPEKLEKDREKELALLNAFRDRKKQLLQQQANDAKKATEELEQMAADKEARDEERRNRELDHIKQQVGQPADQRDQFKDFLSQISATERLAETEERRRQIAERRQQLGREATSDRETPTAIQLRDIDEERLRIREDAAKQLDDAVRKSQGVYQAEIQAVGKHADGSKAQIEQQKELERLRKQFDDAVAARRKNADELEKDRKAAQLRRDQEAFRLNLEWEKQLADAKKKHDDAEKQRKAELEKQRQDVVAKIKQELLAEQQGPNGQAGPNLFQQFNANIDDRDVTKQALSNRQREARDAFLAELRKRGQVDAAGKAQAAPGEELDKRQVAQRQREQDAAFAKVKADVGRDFARDVRGGRAVEDLANAREQLFQGGVAGLQMQGRLNLEQGRALMELAAEQRKAAVDAANLRQQIAGIRKAVPGGKAAAALPEPRPAKKPADAAKQAVKEIAEADANQEAVGDANANRKAEPQRPLFFDDNEPVPSDLAERRKNAGIEDASPPAQQPLAIAIPALVPNQAANQQATNAVGSGLKQLADNQSKADSAVVEALNSVAELLTEQARRQVQLHSVVAQITDHVNQLQGQFLAADDALQIKAIRAATV